MVIGNAKVVETVIEGGSTVDRADNAGRTPIHYAAWNGSIITIELLILFIISHIVYWI